MSLTNADNDDIHRLDLGGREFIIVGVAHISLSSVNLVRETIGTVKPDCVCVELDRKRYESLADPDQWLHLDIRQILREKRMSAFISQISLMSFQRRLGNTTGSPPGLEMLEAVRSAEKHGIPFRLCDRDVHITLRRAWASTSGINRMLLLSTALAALFDRTTLTAEQLESMRKHDILSGMLSEIGDVFPSLKETLIDERDQFLATRIDEAPGNRIVAVVGAGHVEGVIRALQSSAKPCLSELDQIPASSKMWLFIGWGIPISIVAALVWIGISKGLGVASDNLIYWILANGIPSAVGAALALAHPLTIATVFCAAPLTSLTPVIGAGYVAAFVQAWLRPPRVHEVQRVAEDIVEIKKWWQNRLLRIFLVFLLPGFGSMLGTWIGGVEIMRNLF